MIHSSLVIKAACYRNSSCSSWYPNWQPLLLGIVIAEPTVDTNLHAAPFNSNQKTETEKWTIRGKMTCLMMFNMEVCWKINYSLFNIYISHHFSHSCNIFFILDSKSEAAPGKRRTYVFSNQNNQLLCKFFACC